MMNYQCVQARFLFFNGKQQYTVEFGYSTFKWYIFEEEKTTDAVFVLQADHKKLRNPDRDDAEDVLYEYLNDK